MRHSSPLNRAGFHSHFTFEFIWRPSSSKGAKHLDVRNNSVLPWMKIANESPI